MLFWGNQKLSKSLLSAASLDTTMDKEVRHVWKLPLTMDSDCHINNDGVGPTRGRHEIIDQWKGVEVHTETCHPQLLFFRSIIPVRKQQISERNHLTIFHGLCLIQVFHMMVSMRLKLSSKYMLIRKMNLDVSYWRIHTKKNQMNIHINCGKTCLSASMDTIYHHNITGKVKKTPAKQ